MRKIEVLLSLAAVLSLVASFSPVSIVPLSRHDGHVAAISPSAVGMSSEDITQHHQDAVDQDYDSSSPSRRALFTTLGQQSAVVVAVTMMLTTSFTVSPALAASSTINAQVTDKIYVDIKGLVQDQPPQRIVIGLFGKDAPEATEMLKALVSPQGLRAPCKPREVRSLQKEQLEANKVYNSCLEGEDKGVNYDYATIWRVVKDERIDVGAVSGRFVARQFPTWTGSNDLKNDIPGAVSVRRGSDSGFGFTIYPGNGDSKYLDENHIVVGRVIEGMNVQLLNDMPVVTSAKLPSFAELPPAPSRACRYGGSQLYCNEYKPLQKLSLSSTGVL